MARSLRVSRPLHIAYRARGHVVAAGEIDADSRVVWEETEDSVNRELGRSGRELRPPLEWFEL
jgi:hypothetical protein